MAFFLYKGLKKPLVLFGLKDKYIYQAGAFAVGGIIGVAVLPNLIGWVGFVMGIIIGAGGIWWTFKKQDTKGLYNRNRNHDERHIFPKRFKKIVRKNKNDSQ